MRAPRSRWWISGLAGLCLVAACSGGSDASAGDTTTEPSTSTTTAAPAAAGAAYADLGPYSVGVTTLTLGDREVEVWYPADGDLSGQPTDSYSIADWLPESVRSALPESDRPEFDTGAVRDAAPSADGPFPLVVFSHGVLSFRDQSTFLTVPLASWGFVVMAPDHPERGIQTIFGAPSGVVDDVGDLQRTIDLGLTENATAGSVLDGMIAPGAIGAVGHSAGGVAVIRLGATDPRVQSVVAQAASIPGDVTWPAGKDLMLIAGTADDIVSAANVRATWDPVAGQPGVSLVMIDGAGHLAFSDICEIGKDRGGIFGIAADNGVAVNDAVRILGTDGCHPDETEATSTWPAIRHFTVADLRATLGVDPSPIGLDADVVAEFEGLTIEYHPAG